MKMMMMMTHVLSNRCRYRYFHPTIRTDVFFVLTCRVMLRHRLCDDAVKTGVKFFFAGTQEALKCRWMHDICCHTRCIHLHTMDILFFHLWWRRHERRQRRQRRHPWHFLQTLEIQCSDLCSNHIITGHCCETMRTYSTMHVSWATCVSVMCID